MPTGIRAHNLESPKPAGGIHWDLKALHRDLEMSKEKPGKKSIKINLFQRLTKKRCQVL